MRRCTSATPAQNSCAAACTPTKTGCNGQRRMRSRVRACCAASPKPTPLRCCPKTLATSSGAMWWCFGIETSGADQSRWKQMICAQSSALVRVTPVLRDNAAMSIREISPCEARQCQQSGALLLDVREPYEQAAGMAEGAIALSLGDVAARVAAVEPDK